jgi:hypothetical protein
MAARSWRSACWTSRGSPRPATGSCAAPDAACTSGPSSIPRRASRGSSCTTPPRESVDSDIERRRRWALTLADAAEAGAARADDQARASEVAEAAVASASPAGIAPLLVLREGWLPPLEAELTEALAADLKRAVDGSAPAWMPERVAEAVRRHPEYVDVVRAP